mmetsp:Transcript_23389/g.69171  ORF Transcript_23389/g.69171 Transcript_23389/m.69171 type:complete len:261 (+) Transcript_23389:1074-1856(+)
MMREGAGPRASRPTGQSRVVGLGPALERVHEPEEGVGEHPRAGDDRIGVVGVVVAVAVLPRPRVAVHDPRGLAAVVIIVVLKVDAVFETVQFAIDVEIVPGDDNVVVKEGRTLGDIRVGVHPQSRVGYRRLGHVQPALLLLLVVIVIVVILSLLLIGIRLLPPLRLRPHDLLGAVQLRRRDAPVVVVRQQRRRRIIVGGGVVVDARSALVDVIAVVRRDDAFVLPYPRHRRRRRRRQSRSRSQSRRRSRRRSAGGDGGDQ